MPLEITNKMKCSGCYVCANICPKNCISMVEDGEGFLYPQVDKIRCVDCGLCEKVCPILNNNTSTKKKKIKAYAAYSTDDIIRLSSSSGGVFSLISEIIIEQGGVVFGAAFDKDFNVIHTYTETKNGLEQFRGSKYVQSKIGETYKQAKEFLDSGRLVLYTGTPCQIGGLYAFLRKDYDNLFTQDLICHGVPSPLVFRKYIEHRQKNSNSNVRRISFRCKDSGWKTYSVLFEFSDDTEYMARFNKDPFIQAFLKDYCLRPSCYKCSFKTINRQADITLADFWGIQNVLPKMDDDKGTSLVLIHSKKGRVLFAKISSKIKFLPINIDSAIKKYNLSMIQSASKPRERKLFMDYIQKMDFDKALEKTNNKIGIISFYYNNHNYGGMLQAYALCEFLNQSEFNAEQICYVRNNKPLENAKNPTKHDKHKIVKYFNPKNYLRFAKKKLYRFADKYHISNKPDWKVRIEKFNKFQNSIPHSQEVYYKDTIEQSCKKYDKFIVGSDQVWNMAWTDDTYFLSFLNDKKRKISYAASFGNTNFSDEQLKFIKEKLLGFKAISVREEHSADVLKQILPEKSVEWVLDPTLLLEREDWDKLAAERLIKKKYIVCYIFGEDDKLRNLVKQFAKDKKIKIVNIAHLYDYRITKSDIGFGDYKFNNISPNEFISLIKYSECVFTNSFHACVFASVYHKNFFVFRRHDLMDMTDRIYSLCQLFECQDNFCNTDDKCNIEYINKIYQTNNNKELKLFKKMQNKSKTFLINSLLGIE